MKGLKKAVFRFPRIANYGKVNILEETNGVRFVCRCLSCYLWAYILLLGSKRGRVESAFLAFAA